MPTLLVIRTTVWDSRDPETFSPMLLCEKLDDGGIYTEFANAEVHRLDERAGFGFADYDGATELDHQDLIRLQGKETPSPHAPTRQAMRQSHRPRPHSLSPG